MAELVRALHVAQCQIRMHIMNGISKRNIVALVVNLRGVDFHTKRAGDRSSYEDGNIAVAHLAAKVDRPVYDASAVGGVQVGKESWVWM